MEPYINGCNFTRTVKAPYRAQQDLFEQIYKLVQISATAKQNLRIYEVPKEFYQAEPDIANFIPRVAKEEMFYALKNGFISEKVPAKCIYYILKIYNIYKIPNLIFKQIPEKELNIMFQENYLAEGFTLRDVVCTFCDGRYTPLSPTQYVTLLGTYAEVYIQATDMVAIIPVEIARSMSFDDIQKLEVDDYGIKLDQTYIKFLGGYHGACESTYDLRTLI